MERGQGRRFHQEKIDRIKYLLAETDLTIPEIATRMGCSGGPIVSINRRFGIRTYNAKRKQWSVNRESVKTRQTA